MPASKDHLQVHLSDAEMELVRLLAKRDSESMSNVVRAAIGVMRKLEVLRGMTPNQRAQLPTSLVAYLLDPYPHEDWLK